MKKTFLFTLITSAVLLFSGVGCKKEGLVAPPAQKKTNLTVETVSGPTTEDCGGFNWRVKFNLNEASKGGGWIVQKVTYDRNVIKCPALRFLNNKITYWEAWRVIAGAKGDSERLAGRFNFDDQYSSPNFPDTKGNTTITGEVRFFEGLTLPATFRPNNNQTYAGALPATTAKPVFWDATNAADHNLSLIWNCCINPKFKQLTVTPDSKKPAVVIPPDTLMLDAIGRKIFRLFSWSNFYDRNAPMELLNTAREIQQTTTAASLHNSLVNYENAMSGSTDYVENMSKAYLLLRVLYDLPVQMDRSNAKVFGGWIHPSIEQGSTFNLSWPMNVTNTTTGLQLEAEDYTGYLGRQYDAAGELDYFNANFPKRNLF